MTTYILLPTLPDRAVGNMKTKEIKVRFLEIDTDALIRKLTELGASDGGEKMLNEMIFYDRELKWREAYKLIRLRSIGSLTILTYKENLAQGIDSAREIEFEVSDIGKATTLLEELGLMAYRHQQKRRHSFTLRNVAVDIDTWPGIPTYAELEGSSEQALKAAAKQLGFNWSSAVFEDVRHIIENRYGIPVRTLKWFTFERVA